MQTLLERGESGSVRGGSADLRLVIGKIRVDKIYEIRLKILARARVGSKKHGQAKF